MVLGAALPETAYEKLADWPLGRRNSALAELRCSAFGWKMDGLVGCPRCEEGLEFSIDGRALIDSAANESPNIVVNGHSFRLPTTRDLAQAAREIDARSAAVQLLNGCCLDCGDLPVWSDEDLEAVGDKMAAADAMAETRMTFRCAECAHEWEETLDMATFLWSEVEAHAKRVLREVHTLASAYGWNETEILSLSDRRRASYMQMVQQ
jgi:hypothetical protein